jgi:hypothetical protein
MPKVNILLLAPTALVLFGCAARPPAPTPRTLAANVPPTTVATNTAASPSTGSSTEDGNGVVDQSLVKRGYKARQINGQLKYCQTQTLTGTHFSNTVCLTRDQIKAIDANTQSGVDQLGRAARAACPNNKCD